MLRNPKTPRTLYVGLSHAIPSWKPVCVLIRWAEKQKTFNPLSWIRLFQASHVFTVFPAHENRNFYLVNEAAGTMCRWVSEPYFKAGSEITNLYRLQIQNDLFSAIKLYGERYSGAPYAVMENLGILVVRLFKLIGMRIKNPFGKNSGAQKCSELVMREVIIPFIHSLDTEFTLEHLRLAVKRDRGHELSKDIDVLGVADLHEILEWLSDHGYIERVHVRHDMKIAG